jgi:hypothetical protein
MQLVEITDADPDPHYFWNLDPDPHYSEKLDPDPKPH